MAWRQEEPRSSRRLDCGDGQSTSGRGRYVRRSHSVGKAVAVKTMVIDAGVVLASKPT